MRSIKTVLLQCVVMLVLCFPAMAMEYPKEFGKEFPPCKGSEVIQVMDMQGSQMLNQICQDTPENVAALYVQSAKDAGYKILMENKMQEMTMIVAEKGDITFTATVGKDKGKTMASLVKGKK